MKIGVLKEDKPNEKRVALTPSTVSKIRKLGYDISIETMRDCYLIFLIMHMRRLVLGYPRMKIFLNVILS